MTRREKKKREQTGGLDHFSANRVVIRISGMAGVIAVSKSIINSCIKRERGEASRTQIVYERRRKYDLNLCRSTRRHLDL
jgi:hypothetical protein